MKKTGLKAIIAALSITFVAGAFVGCGNKEEKSANNKELSGTITAAGSTALQPLAEQVAKQFNDNNPGVTVNVQGGGSGTGLTQVSQGSIDIGNSDIFAEEKLKAEDAKVLVDHKVAVVGFAVVTNSKVKVTNLTKAQLIDIFTGKVTNWKEVGGDDMKIQIINRPKSSGTRATFKKYGLDGKDEVEGVGLQEDSSGLVQKTIQSTDGSIGYLALSYLTTDVRKSINVLKLDGLDANKENITAGKYPIWSYEHMYTKGEPKELIKAYIDYMSKDEVKPILDKLGYISVKDMKVTR
ncbi:phosphate ABC transporter substrate-binding protein [Clostridium omnivorum]|uniref:Phosphate-binding protein n=1 Tax=Clostridium omnivorum TaxID=1604902 RepID=A0ABQ5NCC2_9CLOT|nr:phosphate ABC transporter substrate-binding protein [Clostridium sp. E14]GLC32837.1 phosphate ABC transporter substrate-binding protein [Clostridium sp. E14]